MKTSNFLATQMAALADRAKNALAMRVAEALAKHMVPWATYAYNGGIRGGTGIAPTYSPHKLSVTEVKFDFAVIAAERLAAGVAAIAATDVLQAVGVKAGVWVPLVTLQVTTVEGAAATTDIGDGTATAGYFSAANLNALGYSPSVATSSLSVAVGGGKQYTVDDTIDLLINSNNVDVAVAKLLVVQVDLRPVTN